MLRCRWQWPRQWQRHLQRLSFGDVGVILRRFVDCFGMVRLPPSCCVRVRLVARPNYVSVKLPITFVLLPFTGQTN